MNKFELGCYYKIINPVTNEETIVYYYYNLDALCTGFGFNTADGGGFLPEFDLRKDSIVKKLTLIECEE